MCLSTVYQNNVEPAQILMKNVCKIEVEGDTVRLTDVMECTRSIQGALKLADLVNGTVVLSCANSEA